LGVVRSVVIPKNAAMITIHIVKRVVTPLRIVAGKDDGKRHLKPRTIVKLNGSIQTTREASFVKLDDGIFDEGATGFL